MNPKFRLLLVLLLPMLSAWGGCGALTKKAPPRIEPPLIDCNEHTPAEVVPAPPRADTVPEWKANAIRWQGVATAELIKRVETAECLDRERAEGHIK